MRSRAAVLYEYGSPWTVDEINEAYAAKAAGELIRGVADFGVTRA